MHLGRIVSYHFVEATIVNGNLFFFQGLINFDIAALLTSGDVDADTIGGVQR